MIDPTKVYGKPNHETYVICVRNPAPSCHFKNSGKRYEEDQKILKMILNYGTVVENVKIISDNIYIKNLIGCEPKHVEFNVVGDERVIIVNYSWLMVANTEENLNLLKEIEETNIEINKIEVKKMEMIRKSLFNSYDFSGYSNAANADLNKVIYDY